MMRKPLVLVAAMGLLVAACGGDEESDAGSTSTVAAETTAAPETTRAPDDTSVETTAGGSDVGGVTLDEAGRLVPAECSGDDNVANEDEGVTADTVNLVALNIDLAPVAELGFAASGRDMSYMSSVFVDEINDKGGVCGRTIDLAQVKYNALEGATARGESCVEATQDRANLAAFSVAYEDPVCVTEGGVVMIDHADVTEGQSADSGGLLFSRKPSVEDQYLATVQYALDSGALDGKVGVWYGDIRSELSDAFEDVVMPILDEADIDYTAVRTDFPGPYVPEGNAVLTAAATEFASAGVDTMLLFVNNLNLTGLQLELDAQGAHPRYVSMPISANTTNELFAEAYGTRDIADGMEYVTYTASPTEIDESDPVARSCNEVWTQRTGELVETNTFDYQLVGTVCAIVDEIVAALSVAGGALSRESFVAALDSLPAHHAPSLFSDIDWLPDYHFGPTLFSVQDYQGGTNTMVTRADRFELEA
jgi:ABC-type branched-subunit amino acid transport system substrate-binding protein